MASETWIQSIIHRLEEGGWAKWIRRTLLCVSVIYVAVLWLGLWGEPKFKGLNHERAIEQAQIAREIARGNGFSTKMIRPAAIWQFQKNTGAFPLNATPDTYHAPLNPYLSAIILKASNFVRMKLDKELKDPWEMSIKDRLYPGDRVLATVQLLFFLAAIFVNYLTFCRLFDQRLATFVTIILLACQRFWDFALVGLPQMLMLLLFSGVVYLFLRAIEARVAGKSTLWWAVGIGALFGLLALTHALTLWMFGGALVFALFYFTPRLRDAAVMIAVVALVYSPWLVRNARVCGNPFGLSWYSGMSEIRGTEGQVMRSMDLKPSDVNPTLFRIKVTNTIVRQLGNIYSYLGHVVVAPVFFLAMLHIFKRPETTALRWCGFLMWIFAVLGMAVFGLNNETDPHNLLSANDLHILFVPLFACFGFALVLVMWTRLDINVRLVRIAFMAMIYLVSALPFIQVVIDLHKQSFGYPYQWPPYVPPWIAILSKWTTEREIIASDMPWGVAWYADRKSLWLPKTTQDFVTLNDYKTLGNNLVGLYLTPVTGDTRFMRDAVKGEYKEWAPFVIRQLTVKDFPLRAVTGMPIENECVFYADRDRWSSRED
ncbi:MAG TPA: glycosyltransferase family 39 protein [Chthoniobacteraceae bacterium]|jgi:hypothetical protein|nr:glycosyltransferase family 39 protein [Chthoniobacteraceae bacterium]